MSEQRNDKAEASDGELELSIENTSAQRSRGLSVKKRTPGSGGYNPYDAAPAAQSAEGPQRPTDLRKLSEWIRLQRQVDALKKEKPEKL